MSWRTQKSPSSGDKSPKIPTGVCGSKNKVNGKIGMKNYKVDNMEKRLASVKYTVTGKLI